MNAIVSSLSLSQLKSRSNSLWQQVKKSDLAYSFIVVAVWRIVIQIYAVFSLHRFDFFSPAVDRPFYWLSVWLNYDGGHYTSIAHNGYQLVQHAFFPLYPLLLKVSSWPLLWFTDNYKAAMVVSGTVINYVALALAVYFLLQIGKIKFSVDAGRKAVLLLLFFPSAIYLAAIYNESLFLALSLGSFYFTYRKQWLLAGLLAGMAAATRLVGIWLFPVLLLEWLLIYRGQWRRHLGEALPLLLIPLSLGLYMAFQWWSVGNPLQFIESQKAWDRAIDSNAAVELWKQFSYGIDLSRFSSARVAPMYDAVIVVLFIAGSIGLMLKRLWAMAAYSLLVLLSPLISGQTVGAIRYAIVAFPVILLFAWLAKHQTTYSFLLAISVIAMALLSLHYLHGWWFA